MKNKSYTKKALTLSLLLMLIWSVLGAGTTVAWFTDTTTKQKNTFYTGELDLKVTYKNEFGKYVDLEPTSNVFNDYALYEPGYVEVAYLQIENIGDIAFDYTTAVTVNDYSTAINKYGSTFNLLPYLTYGVVFADSEDELSALLDTRSEALSYANSVLNIYNSDVDTLNINEKKFMALIVSMPTWVGNEANHTGDAPWVKLGISVKASQSGTLE